MRSNTHHAAETLLLGAAQATITPTEAWELSGFVARTSPMHGVHDDLYARALVWSDGAPTSHAVLLTLDLIGLDFPTIAAIRQRINDLTRIPPERVAITVTHTHGGPAVMEGRLGGHTDPAYMRRLIETTANVVASAASAMSATTARLGMGHEPTIGKNRRVSDGPIDADVPVVRFDGPNGDLRALLVSYACHPVTLGANNLLVTADYPGYLVHTLESIYPGAHVQFATGCCGEINTGHLAQDSVTNRGLDRRTYQECARIGRALAGAALQATEQSGLPGGSPQATAPSSLNTPTPLQVRRRQVELPLLTAPSPQDLLTQAASWRAEAARSIGEHGVTGDALLLQNWAEWAEQTASRQNEDNSQRALTAEVMVLLLGHIRIVLLPGEPFMALGREIKNRLGNPPVIVLAYANGVPGYIPDRAAYSEGGYEVTDAYRFYNYAAPFAPEAGENLVNAAVDLLRDE